jgi:ribosomal protein S27AE
VNELSPEQKRKVVEALEKVGARLPCPRCGNNNFTLLDGYFNQPVQTELAGLVLGGPSVPSAVVVCTRCGYLSQHALGALGLLPKEAPKVTPEEVKK